MDSLRLLAKGLVIGFSIAAPVGPIGVLVIRRTLAGGRLRGLASGLGAATADALYGSIAALGLVAVSSLLVEQSGWLRLAGGGFLIYLGMRTFFAPPATLDGPQGSAGAPRRGDGLPGAYLSTFFLTLTNPLTILAFTGILAGLGLGEAGGDIRLALLLVGGVFAGSALWWVILSGGVSLLRRKVRDGWMVWINRASGAIIAGAGTLALVGLARALLGGGG